MTSYLETRDVAHVMEWQGGGRWEAVCYSRYNCQRSVAINAGDYRLSLDEWPLRHSTRDERTKPWCSRCAWYIQQRVNDWDDAGLLAGRETRKP